MNFKLLCGIATVGASLLVASCSNPISSGDVNDDILTSAKNITFSSTIESGKTFTKTFAMNGANSVRTSYKNANVVPRYLLKKGAKNVKRLAATSYDSKGKKIGSSYVMLPSGGMSDTYLEDGSTGNGVTPSIRNISDFNRTTKGSKVDNSGNWTLKVKNTLKGYTQKMDWTIEVN